MSSCDVFDDLYMFSHRPLKRTRQGIALLEVMIAVGLLTLAVSSITQAIVAAQQQNLEVREQIVASIAAESLLSQIGEDSWENLSTWDGFREEVGTLTDPTGSALEGDWKQVGREVTITATEIFIDELQIFIAGKTINVIAFTKNGRELVNLERFIAEPSS